MIYAFIFLIIAIVLGFVYLTSFHGTSQTNSYCYITPELPCQGVFVISNSVSPTSSTAYLVFKNNQGTGIHLPSNAFYFYPSSSTASYPGQCLPSNVPDGSTVVCNATLNTASPLTPGAQVNPKFSVTYQVCNNSSCVGLNANTAVLNTTGTGTLYVSENINVPYFYIVTIGGASINVTINGARYAAGSNIVVFKNIKYSLFGNPPSGHYFGSWTSTGGVSINTAASQATTFTATGDGTLSGSDVIITSTSTSSSSTYTSSTSTSTSSSTTSTSSTSTSSTTSTSSSTSTVATASTVSTTTTTSSSTSTSSTSTQTTTSTTTSTTTTVGGGGGGGCIAGTDQIQLYSGAYANASDISVGEYINGYDNASGTHIPLRVTLITTSNTSVMEWINGNLGITPYDEPIYIRNSTYTGWVKDPLVVKKGWYVYSPGKGWIAVDSVTYTFGNYEVYNIYANGTDTYQVNGYLLDPHKN